MATTYGWVTLAEANLYFTTRMNASKWTASTEKESALTTAYNYLIASGAFSLPSTTTDAMKKAQYEQALFLLIHGAGLEMRAGIQAQGVKAAGIVKEQYKESTMGDIPIAPMATSLLSNYEVGSALYAAELDRDDDEDVS